MNLPSDFCQDVKKIKQVKVNYRSFLKRRLFSCLILKVIDIYGVKFERQKFKERNMYLPQSCCLKIPLLNI